MFVLMKDESLYVKNVILWMMVILNYNYFSLFLYLVKLGVCLRIFILFCFKVCRICGK